MFNITSTSKITIDNMLLSRASVVNILTTSENVIVNKAACYRRKRPFAIRSRPWAILRPWTLTSSGTPPLLS
jgi:hypothetical protein